MIPYHVRYFLSRPPATGAREVGFAEGSVLSAAEPREHRFSGKEVTGMKVVAVLLMAAFVITTSFSYAFADCAGHTKAQLVKSEPQEQLSTVQPTTAPITVAEKVAEPEQPVAKAPEKK
jgi:hypothetical protein